MIEIIPAILVHSEEEFREKILRVGAVATSIQIDVMDGVFVNNTTWADSAVIAAMHLPYKIEVHLMVANPVVEVERWFGIAERILVHAESPGWQEAVAKCRVAGCEIGVVLNPETPAAVVERVIDSVDVVQVMGVTPGWSGQVFQSSVVEKVQMLHRIRPDAVIEVDGGVDKKTLPQIVAAGATRVAVGSALFDAEDFLGVYSTLTRLYPGG
jgi:ribulose-phosphate 3-epimerase